MASGPLSGGWLAVVWLTYGGLFVGTLLRRREPHSHVANWFYCP